jgi:threonine/homoserine efflux transporter RhtA
VPDRRGPSHAGIDSAEGIVLVLRGAALWIMLALAALSPVLPFALEFLALRRLTISVFGTLMSLEPAIAMLIGLLVLGQKPGLAPAPGIVFVVIAGVSVTRAGARPTATPEVTMLRGEQAAIQEAS